MTATATASTATTPLHVVLDIDKTLVDSEPPPWDEIVVFLRPHAIAALRRLFACCASVNLWSAAKRPYVDFVRTALEAALDDVNCRFLLVYASDDCVGIGTKPLGRMARSADGCRANMVATVNMLLVDDAPVLEANAKRTVRVAAYSVTSAATRARYKSCSSAFERVTLPAYPRTPFVFVARGDAAEDAADTVLLDVADLVERVCTGAVTLDDAVAVWNAPPPLPPRLATINEE